MGDVTFAFSNPEQAEFWFSNFLDKIGFSKEDKTVKNKLLPFSAEYFKNYCDLCHEKAIMFEKISLCEVRKASLLAQKNKDTLKRDILCHHKR